MKGFTKDANEIGGPGEFELPDSVCNAMAGKNRYEFRADLKNLGINMDSEICVSILNYSEDNTVDWTMPAITYLVTMQRSEKVDISDKLIVTWAGIKNKRN